MVDFGDLLKKHSKAILVGIPGAFTPVCSQTHWPGFLARMPELKAKGVEQVYCMSVNDAYTMQAWGDSTENCWESGAQLIADGNGEATTAMNLQCDCSEWRMGSLRCKRFAAIVCDGKFTVLNVDEDGLDQSSVEAILALL
jgi:peroxiredoxin